MKITKKYCDLCNKEISISSQNNLKISGYVNLESKMGHMVDIEVCRECIVQFWNMYYKLYKDYDKNPLDK